MVGAITAGCPAGAGDDAGLGAGAGANGQGGDGPLSLTVPASSGANGSTNGTGGASTRLPPLALSGTVTTPGGTPIAGASVALAANPEISTSTNAAGEFSLQSEFAMGRPLPPRWPVSRPVEHTLIVKSAGYLDAYRGVPGATSMGESIVMLAAAPVGTIGPAEAGEPTVAEYRGNKLAAVTMTFDDTYLSQLTVSRPLFDLYGCKATFYVNSANIGGGQYTTWAMWKEAADMGFEIGNHSRSHWIKPECTTENYQFNWDEMHGGAEDILAGIGRPPRTFAFPGGGASVCTVALVAPSGHVDYRRNDHLVPDDRLYPEGDDLTVATGVAAIDAVIAHTPSWNGAILSWLLFYMHDVTADRAAVLEAMLDHVALHDSEVWCTGYTEVTLYQREREQSVLQVLGREPRSLTFRLSSALDPATFNEPLTVIVPVPANTPDIRATAFREAGGPIEVRVRPDALQVDVVPGDAPVHVAF